VTLDTVEGDEELELSGSSTPPNPIADVRIPEGFDGDAYEERFLPFLKRPVRVRVYLLERDDLLDWARYRDFLPR
jgi:hypothetical protein